MKHSQAPVSIKAEETQDAGSSSWVDWWARYIESFDVEDEVKSAAQLFSSATKAVSRDKWHVFEYEFKGKNFRAILKESAQAGEPVQAQETEDGWIAHIQINPVHPEEYRFVFCSCGQPH